MSRLSKFELEQRRKAGQPPAKKPLPDYHQAGIRRAARLAARAAGNMVYRARHEPQYVRNWISYAKTYSEIKDTEQGLDAAQRLVAAAVPVARWAEKLKGGTTKDAQAWRRVQRSFRRLYEAVEALHRNLERQETMRRLGQRRAIPITGVGELVHEPMYDTLVSII